MSTLRGLIGFISYLKLTFFGDRTACLRDELEMRLKRIVKEDDSVLIYIFPGKNFDLHVVGRDKSPVEMII